MNSTRATRYSWEYIALAGLTIAAFGTRLFGLGDWAVYGDETFVISRALDRAITIINPIYYWLIVFSTNLFGVNEFAARLPAAILGASGIVIFWLTWRKVVGPQTALFAACFLLLNSWHLYHSQYARFYAGVFIFSSLAYYFYYRALNLDSYRYCIASVAAAAGAVLFHVTAIMVPLGCFIFSLLVLARRPNELTECPSRIAKAYIYLCIGCGLLALPSLFGLLQHWTVSGTPAPGALTILLRIVRSIGMPETILAILGLSVALRKQKLFAIFAIVAAGISGALVIGGAEFLGMRNDYVFYLLVFVALLSGLLVSELLELSRASRLAQGLVFCVFLLPFPNFVSFYSDKLTLDVREAMAFVVQRHNPDDVVVSYSNEFTYYAEEHFSVERRPASPVARGTDWDAAMKPHLRSYARTWIVVRRNQSPLVTGFERWLIDNAQLKWRKFSTRYDRVERGYEIWLVEARGYSP